MDSDYPRGTCENVVYHFHRTIQTIITSYLRPVYSLYWILENVFQNYINRKRDHLIPEVFVFEIFKQFHTPPEPILRKIKCSRQAANAEGLQIQVETWGDVPQLFW